MLNCISLCHQHPKPVLGSRGKHIRARQGNAPAQLAFDLRGIASGIYWLKTAMPRQRTVTKASIEKPNLP